MATNYEKFASTPEKLAANYGTKISNEYTYWLLKNHPKVGEETFEESMLEWLQEECDG